MPSDHLALSTLQPSFAKDQPTLRNNLQDKIPNLPLTAFGNRSCRSISYFQKPRQAGFMDQPKLKGID
jgi:hypothetical protein